MEFMFWRNCSVVISVRGVVTYSPPTALSVDTLPRRSQELKGRPPTRVHMLESRQLASADLVNHTLDARVGEDVSFDESDALLRSNMANELISRVLVPDYSQDIPLSAESGLDGSDADVTGCTEDEDCVHVELIYCCLERIFLCIVVV